MRAEQTTRGEPLEVEELMIDPHVVQAYVAGESAELTPTEFRLLHALDGAGYRSEPVAKDGLAASVDRSRRPQVRFSTPVDTPSSVRTG